MCFYDDDGYCEVYEETVRVARKAHQCVSCGRDILPRQQYVSVFSIYEGTAGSEKICNLCVQDARAIERHEQRAGCTGSEATPPWPDVAELIRNGNPDEYCEPEFPGDNERGFGHVLSWPYGVPPATQQVDLKARSE